MVVTWRVGQVRSGAYSHEPGREPRLWGSTGTNGVGDEVPTPPCDGESPYAGVGELPP